MEKLFSLGHMVAIWLDQRERRTPAYNPIEISIRLGQSNWNRVFAWHDFNQVCVWPESLFCACIHVHPWLSTKSETCNRNWNSRSNSQKNFHNNPGHWLMLHFWSETFVLQCFTPMCFGFASQESWQNATACRLQTYMCCSSFSGTPSCGVFLYTGTC